LLLVSTVATPIAGQQKRRTTEKPPAKVAPAPPTVTFDTLIAADTFKIYGEVRSVGQLVRSNAANDVLEPILRLGGPPKEFSSLVGWLRGHADDLMTSRLLVAALPNEKEVPNVVVAIEFSSPEEATKLESQLNSLLSSVLPPVPQSRVEDEPQSPPKPMLQKAEKVEKLEKDKKPTAQASESATPPPPPKPAYYLKRADSLLLITLQPLALKKLRPKGSKLLSEDANFRVAYNRFSSEPIFVYIDFDAISRDQQERMKEMEEQQKKAEEEQKALEEKMKAEPPPSEEGGEGEKGEEGEAMPEPPPPAGMPTEMAVAKPESPTESQMLGNAFSELRMVLFSNIPDLPNGLGIGFAPENESFELRVLIVNAPGETSDAIPFFTGIRLGAPTTPESARVLPATTEMMAMMSIDYPEMHSRISLMEARADFLAETPDGAQVPLSEDQMFAPLKTIEKLLKIKIKDELLPVLGSEIAISLPSAGFNPFGPPNISPQPQSKEESEEATAAPNAPIVAISIRDREAARQILPKILAGFGGNAAASLAQTERREDTELVSIANMFAYAFIGNFLVLSTDAAATRYAVDSYLKGQTLSADPHFRNSTRWQPRMVQGQVYFSPAVAESYKTWANSSTTHLTDETRNFITRLSANPQPITYSLSNDGLGSLHELRVPRNIVTLAVAGMATAENPPEAAKNERSAMYTLWQIANAERQYKEKTGATYGSIEQLVETEILSKESVATAGYKIDLRVTAEGFEVTAVPTEYGKTGKLSFFLDQSGVVRGADRGGAAASASDQPVNP
jgi:hypothetical protein